MAQTSDKDLLIYLDSALDADKYKVFDWGELREGAQCDDVEQSLQRLKTDGFVIVKYADEGEVCLSMTVNGRTVASRMRGSVKNEEEYASDAVYTVSDISDGAKTAVRKNSLWLRIRTAVISVICGLLGGVIGGAAMYLALTLL